jgi:hypothetical protein
MYEDKGRRKTEKRRTVVSKKELGLWKKLERRGTGLEK